MGRWLAILLLVASGSSGAQPLLDFPDDFAFQSDAVERFAERAYSQNLEGLRKASRLDTDAALLARLRPLVARLARAVEAERPDAGSPRWELHSCRECGESASARAGGKLMVGEEFVASNAFTDHEIGFVIAHEMGHVLAQHTREFASVARYFLDNGLRREYWDIQRELDSSFVAQVRLAFVSAQQEQEADRIGFILGARAGFEPEAMLSLLAKLESLNPGAGFGTHPQIGERRARAEAMLQSARAIFQRRPPSR